jgi:hypothetical protein
LKPQNNNLFIAEVSDRKYDIVSLKLAKFETVRADNRISVGSQLALGTPIRYRERRF